MIEMAWFESSAHFDPLSLGNMIPQCVICGEHDMKPRFRLWGEYEPGGDYLDYVYWLCGDCGSLTCDPPPLPNSVAYGDVRPSAWWHYVDIGAGIDHMVRALGNPRVNECLIDVGGGFGFACHYYLWAGSNSNVSGVVVDESTVAHEGRSRLALKLVDPSALETLNASATTVFASEVIEHTPDPTTFARQMRQLLRSATDSFIFTTPRAEFIQPERSLHELLAPLSPGFHTCLLSRDGVRIVLARSGFSSSRIEEHAEGMTVRATPIPGNYFRSTSHVRPQANYLEYLKWLSECNDGRIADGARYRLFKELVNAGEWESAGHVFYRLVESLQVRYKIDSITAPDLADRFERSLRGDLDAHLERFPAWFAPFVFYSAGYFRACNRPGLQAFLLEVADEILRLEQERFPQLAHESRSLSGVAHERLVECAQFIKLRYGIPPRPGSGGSTHIPPRTAGSSIRFVAARRLRRHVERVGLKIRGGFGRGRGPLGDA